MAYTMTTPASETRTASLLEHVVSIDDIFHRHLVPYLSVQDIGHLECVSKNILSTTSGSGGGGGIRNNNNNNNNNAVNDDITCWKIICQRDFLINHNHNNNNNKGNNTTATNIATNNCVAPVYSEERRSFDTLEQQENWKEAYRLWTEWNIYTHGTSNGYHMVRAIELWKRYKTLLENSGMQNIVQSLLPCLSSDFFREMKTNNNINNNSNNSNNIFVPSSLLAAFWSVHGGQQPLLPRSQDSDFFAGIFGSYSCYNNFYSMRLLDIENRGTRRIGHVQYTRPIPRQLPIPSGNGMTIERQALYKNILIGISPGNPRMYLYLDLPKDEKDKTNIPPEGHVYLVPFNPLTDETNRSPLRRNNVIVGRHGVLHYFQTFIEQLEHDTYECNTQIISESPSSYGIGLFPNCGPAMSIAVTRGIEVRASARWFPSTIDQEESGLNFGYSIRIRKLPSSSNDDDDDDDDDVNTNNDNDIPATCQLVGRHLEFMDGNGIVRRVDGEGVIGKQPLFFVDNNNSNNNTSGFVDLGPAGDGNSYSDKVFVYQSQSGPVAGTSRNDTKLASVQGTFSFVPGSITNPSGPMFHVTVAKFPLQITYPFY